MMHLYLYAVIFYFLIPLNGYSTLPVYSGNPPFYLSSSSCLSLPADTETNTLKNLLVSAAAGLLNVSEFANNLLDPSQHHGAAVISTIAIEQKSFGFEPVGLLGFFMWRLHVVPVMYLSGFSPGSLASSYSPKTLICNSELAVSNVMTLNSYVFLCFHRNELATQSG